MAAAAGGVVGGVGGGVGGGAGGGGGGGGAGGGGRVVGELPAAGLWDRVAGLPAREAVVIDMSATSLAGMAVPWAEKAAAVASTMTGARGEPETDGLLSRSAMGIRCVYVL